MSPDRKSTFAFNGGSPKYAIGEVVQFAGHASSVLEVGQREGRVAYLIENGPARVSMWVPENILISHQTADRPPTVFSARPPDVIVVDDFFWDPDEIRDLALVQEYHADLRYFKGMRSTQRFLWPYLREEFGRLLGTPVTEWLGHSANGCFQQTAQSDPLVWHHDTQRYAAAIYLTPDAPLASGTSFWRDKTHGCRRNPTHPAEARRLGSDEALRAAKDAVYDPYNIEHPDNWQLVEAVAGLYNRLVIWDARLFHSATSYDEFGSDGASTRLVQLFFFDAA